MCGPVTAMCDDLLLKSMGLEYRSLEETAKTMNILWHQSDQISQTHKMKPIEKLDKKLKGNVVDKPEVEH